MSSGRQHFIVNCRRRHLSAPPEFRPLARATAAHSTATLNDTSSARFNHSTARQRLLGTPLIGGPQHVPCERPDSQGTQGFVASHDGYVARFGLYHERELSLSHGGNVLAGIDRFLRAGGAAARNNGRDFVTSASTCIPTSTSSATSEDRLVLTRRRRRPLGCSCDEVRADGRGIRSSSPALAARGAAGRSCSPSRRRSFRRSTGS